MQDPKQDPEPIRIRIRNQQKSRIRIRIGNNSGSTTLVFSRSGQKPRYRTEVKYTTVPLVLSQKAWRRDVRPADPPYSPELSVKNLHYREGVGPGTKKISFKKRTTCTFFHRGNYNYVFVSHIKF